MAFFVHLQVLYFFYMIVLKIIAELAINSQQFTRLVEKNSGKDPSLTICTEY